MTKISSNLLTTVAAIVPVGVAIIGAVVKTNLFYVS